MTTCIPIEYCETDPWSYHAGSTGGGQVKFVQDADQTHTASCPLGTTGADVTVTWPSGSFSSGFSQAEANGLALGAATIEAEDRLECV